MARPRITRYAARRGGGTTRGLAHLVVTALLAMTLSACAWAPVSWVSSHITPQIQRVAHALLPPAAPNSSQSWMPASSPEFPPVAGAPDADQLPVSRTVSAAEPGSGSRANFPLAGAYDDAGGVYWDPYYATLCGPGAVSVALSYWPLTPRLSEYLHVADPLLASAPSTSWNNRDSDGVARLRGSIVHLAFQVHAPGWAKSGMLPQSYAQSGEKGGATLQVVRDALNWEASGESERDWAGYFYTTQWNSAYYNRRLYPNNLYEALHTDIVSDIAFHHAPVIVEVTAGFLPNWRATNPVNHFIAITGYDDAAGTYTYIDTCKVYTGCDTGGVDAPGLRTIDQKQLAEAVAHIGTNAATGDGGWVW